MKKQMQAKPQGSGQKTHKLQQKGGVPRTPSSSKLLQKTKSASSPVAAAAAASSSSSAAASSSSPSFLSSLRNADSTFAALLGPSLSPKEFFTRYWEQQPLHISRTKDDPEGGRSFYKGLFSKALFDAHLQKHAAQMKYGFNLNICVCSEEGRKIDMNPKAKGEQHEEGEDDEDDDEQDEEAAPAPQSKKQSKQQSKPAAAAAAAADDDEEEGETMTIAQALKLAASQRAKLKPSAAADDDDEDEEEEESGEDEEAAEQMDDEGESEADEEGDDEDAEEEALDGTSVSTVRNYAPVKFADYARLYSEGCTIQALQPQHYSESMWRVLSQLEEYFGGLAGANCYITPPNSQGLAPHYDDVEVFVLQLEGSKSWKLYHPSQSLPRSHSGDFARDEIGEPFRTVDLQRGDLMYLPRGVIHEARTSAAMSSHMTISVYQKTAYVDFLSALFPMALDAAFESRSTEAFRRGLPLQYLSYMGSAHAMEREIEEGAPEALGITEEEARARSSRHKPQRSTALLGQSRAQLQQSFRGEIQSLLTQLQEHLMDQIDECADVLSTDFMMHRLPPAPASTDSAAAASSSAAAAATPKRKGVAAQYPEELGVPPVLPGAAIRFLHPSAVRMVVVPADSDSDEDEDEAAEAEEEEAERNEGHILLSHSLNNSREHHLDGRFPPHPAAGSIQLPLYFAPAILQLLNAPRASFVPVSALKLEFGGGGGAGEEETLQDEDGNEVDAAVAQRDAQLELANTLWLSKLVQTQMPTAPKFAGGANGNAAPAAAAAAGKQQNKGTKRKGAEEAASSAAAAGSPVQPKKKQQTQAPQQQQQHASNSNGKPKHKQQKPKQHGQQR